MHSVRKTRTDTGLLLLRLGIGLIFIGHGFPKLAGGPERWEAVGGAMSNLGIDSYHIVFGFLAAVTEVFGGLFLILGLYTIPVLILLILTMVVAFITQISQGAGYPAISYPVTMIVIFIAYFFTGPGKYSLDNRLTKFKRRRRLL